MKKKLEMDWGLEWWEEDEFFGTQTRGTNDEEYEIYRCCAEDLGWEVKTYQEWLEK